MYPQNYFGYTYDQTLRSYRRYRVLAKAMGKSKIHLFVIEKNDDAKCMTMKNNSIKIMIKICICKLLYVHADKSKWK